MALKKAAKKKRITKALNKAADIRVKRALPPKNRSKDNISPVKKTYGPLVSKIRYYFYRFIESKRFVKFRNFCKKDLIISIDKIVGHMLIATFIWGTLHLFHVIDLNVLTWIESNALYFVLEEIMSWDKTRLLIKKRLKLQ